MRALAILDVTDGENPGASVGLVDVHPELITGYLPDIDIDADVVEQLRFLLRSAPRPGPSAQPADDEELAALRSERDRLTRRLEQKIADDPDLAE